MLVIFFILNEGAGNALASQANRHYPPADLGIVRMANESVGGLVIHVQDAHENLEAQQSIAGILGDMVERQGIRLIALEGAKGPVDVSFAASFPLPDARRITAERLLREGKISAAEYYAILSGKPFLLRGVEDPDLYEQNRAAFRNLARLRPQIDAELVRLRACVRWLESKIYSQELLEFSLPDSGLSVSWDHLTRAAADQKISLKRYPQLDRFAAAVELENKIDFGRVPNETRALAAEIGAALPLPNLGRLTVARLRANKSENDAADYDALLLELKSAYSRHRDAYPNFSFHAGYTSLKGELDFGAALEEAASLEDAIRSSLIRRPDERSLAGLVRRTEVLSKLLTLTLDPKEHAYWTKHRPSCEVDSVRASLNALLFEQKNKGDGDTPAEPDFDVLKEAVPLAEAFYAAARARDTVLADNTLREMGSNKLRAAALVTGGFHSGGMTDRFRRNDLLCLVVTPAFDAQGRKRPYESLLVEASEQPNAAERSYLAAPAGFDKSSPDRENVLQTAAWLMAASRWNPKARAVVRKDGAYAFDPVFAAGAVASYRDWPADGTRMLATEEWDSLLMEARLSLQPEGNISAVRWEPSSLRSMPFFKTYTGPTSFSVNPREAVSGARLAAEHDITRREFMRRALRTTVAAVIGSALPAAAQPKKGKDPLTLKNEQQLYERLIQARDEAQSREKAIARQILLRETKLAEDAEKRIAGGFVPGNVMRSALADLRKGLTEWSSRTGKRIDEHPALSAYPIPGLEHARIVSEEDVDPSIDPEVQAQIERVALAVMPQDWPWIRKHSHLMVFRSNFMTDGRRWSGSSGWKPIDWARAMRAFHPSVNADKLYESHRELFERAAEEMRLVGVLQSFKHHVSGRTRTADGSGTGVGRKSVDPIFPLSPSVRAEVNQILSRRRDRGNDSDPKRVLNPAEKNAAAFAPSQEDRAFREELRRDARTILFLERHLLGYDPVSTRLILDGGGESSLGEFPYASPAEWIARPVPQKTVPFPERPQDASVREFRSAVDRVPIDPKALQREAFDLKDRVRSSLSSAEVIASFTAALKDPDNPLRQWILESAQNGFDETLLANLYEELARVDRQLRLTLGMGFADNGAGEPAPLRLQDIVEGSPRPSERFGVHGWEAAIVRTAARGFLEYDHYQAVLRSTQARISPWAVDRLRMALWPPAGGDYEWDKPWADQMANPWSPDFLALGPKHPAHIDSIVRQWELNASWATPFDRKDFLNAADIFYRREDPLSVRIHAADARFSPLEKARRAYGPKHPDMLKLLEGESMSPRLNFEIIKDPVFGPRHPVYGDQTAREERAAAVRHAKEMHDFIETLRSMTAQKEVLTSEALWLQLRMAELANQVVALELMRRNGWTAADLPADVPRPSSLENAKRSLKSMHEEMIPFGPEDAERAEYMDTVLQKFEEEEKKREEAGLRVQKYGADFETQLRTDASSHRLEDAPFRPTRKYYAVRYDIATGRPVEWLTDREAANLPPLVRTSLESRELGHRYDAGSSVWLRTAVAVDTEGRLYHGIRSPLGPSVPKRWTGMTGVPPITERELLKELIANPDRVGAYTDQLASSPDTGRRALSLKRRWNNRSPLNKRVNGIENPYSGDPYPVLDNFPLTVAEVGIPDSLARQFDQKVRTADPASEAPGSMVGFERNPLYATGFFALDRRLPLGPVIDNRILVPADPSRPLDPSRNPVFLNGLWYYADKRIRSGRQALMTGDFLRQTLLDIPGQPNRPALPDDQPALVAAERFAEIRTTGGVIEHTGVSGAGAPQLSAEDFDSGAPPSPAARKSMTLRDPETDSRFEGKIRSKIHALSKKAAETDAQNDSEKIEAVIRQVEHIVETSTFVEKNGSIVTMDRGYQETSLVPMRQERESWKNLTEALDEEIDRSRRRIRRLESPLPPKTPDNGARLAEALSESFLDSGPMKAFTADLLLILRSYTNAGANRPGTLYPLVLAAYYDAWIQRYLSEVSVDELSRTNPVLVALDSLFDTEISVDQYLEDKKRMDEKLRNHGFVAEKGAILVSDSRAAERLEKDASFTQEFVVVRAAGGVRSAAQVRELLAQSGQGTTWNHLAERPIGILNIKDAGFRADEDLRSNNAYLIELRPGADPDQATLEGMFSRAFLAVVKLSRSDGDVRRITLRRLSEVLDHRLSEARRLLLATGSSA